MKKKILVGMSGGVDSSVAAALLKERGYPVTGVFMKTWSGGASSGGPRAACYGPDDDDIRDAQKVARHLEIPLHVVDLKEEYRKNVLEPFLEEYRLGRTPNPCVLCNRLVKFGCLLDRAGAAGLEFDYFATGHYARVAYDRRKKRFVLRQASDEKKDQSYFLYRLTQEQLARALFPLGTMTKSEVRALARRFGIPVSEKEESQDFIAGDRSFMLCGGAGPGPVTDKAGNVLGRHKGIELYTVGQRKGLGIAAKRPLYVTAIVPETNTVVAGEERDCYRDTFTASRLNYVSAAGFVKLLRVRAKIRYGHAPEPAAVQPLSSGAVRVVFDRPQWAVTPGQSVVFYRRKTLLGGGIIDS